MFILMAFFSASSGLARDLYNRRRQLVLARQGRPRHRHRIRLRGFRCHVRRQHGRGLGHVQDRHAGDAPPRLFRRIGGRGQSPSATLDILIREHRQVIYGMPTAANSSE